MEENEHLNVDVSTEIRVTHLQLKQILVRQIFCEKAFLFFPTRFRLDLTRRVLYRDRVELEALKGLQDIVGKLGKQFEFYKIIEKTIDLLDYVK